MSPKTLLLAAAALTASAAVPSFAQTTDAPPAATAPAPQARPAPLRATIMFNLIDRNSDGAIDQDEITVLQKAIFASIDGDKDGKLTQAEFGKVTAGLGGQRGRHMRPGRFGHGPDGRGPGFHHRGPGGDRQGQLDDRQGPPGGPMMQQGENEDGPQGQPRDFASLDTNGDGVVSPEEFAAGAPALPGMPPVVR